MTYVGGGVRYAGRRLLRRVCGRGSPGLLGLAWTGPVRAVTDEQTAGRSSARTWPARDRPGQGKARSCRSRRLGRVGPRVRMPHTSVPARCWQVKLHEYTRRHGVGNVRTCRGQGRASRVRQDLGCALRSVGIRKLCQPGTEPDGKPVTQSSRVLVRPRKEAFDILRRRARRHAAHRARRHPYGWHAAVADPDGAIFKLVAAGALMSGARS